MDNLSKKSYLLYGADAARAINIVNLNITFINATIHKYNKN